METFILILVAVLAITMIVLSSNKRKKRVFANNNSTVFVCCECGTDSSERLGKCLKCGEWGTYVEKRLKKIELDPMYELELSKEDLDKVIDSIVRDQLGLEKETDLIDFDPLFEDAARLIVTHQQGSSSLIQRKFSIGYNRVERIMDQLEATGIVGPSQGSKPRDVYIMDDYILEQILKKFYAKAGFPLLSYSKNQIELIKNKYALEIDNRRKKLEFKIVLEKEAKELELEKQRIKEELLAEERRKQLRREVKKELIDSGHIQQDAKRAPIPVDIQDKVWNRDGGKCVLCGSQESLEFDHIIPISKGGANTYRNLQLLCEKCNRRKSDKIG